MKPFAIAAALTAVGLLTAAARPSGHHPVKPPPAAASDDGSRIIGGDVAPKGSAKWQAEIFWNSAERGVGALAQNNHRCGAALIAPSWILTAAHCLGNYSPADFVIKFRVRIGTQLLDDSDGTVFGMAAIIPHEGFVGFTHETAPVRDFTNDIALIRLTAPIVIGPHNADRVQTIAIDRSPATAPLTVPGLPVTVTGWGRATNLDAGHADAHAFSATLGGMEPALKVVRLTVKDPAGLCHNMPSTSFCAGATDAGACVGDSGGPVVHLDSDTRQRTLVGIVSSGNTDHCAVGVSGSKFTRVADFAGWIDATLARYGDRLPA